MGEFFTPKASLKKHLSRWKACVRAKAKRNRPTVSARGFDKGGNLRRVVRRTILQYIRFLAAKIKRQQLDGKAGATRVRYVPLPNASGLWLANLIDIVGVARETATQEQFDSISQGTCDIMFRCR